MFIIVGLGNPEQKYFKTFHNMGYLAVADAAGMLGVKFKKRQCESVCAEANINGERVILAQPLTYMNNSGRAVKQLLAKYKATVRDLVVLYDDYDIPKGKIRIRPNGSAGTHNGMRSVIAELGTSDFARVRIGIRDEAVNVPIINYVLSNVREEDYDLFVAACHRAAEAALRLAEGVPCERVMTDLNG